MVIEFLKFRVGPDFREDFIKIDEEIWTNQLKTYSGFLGKETWCNSAPEKNNEIIIVIRWQSHQQWKSIPLEDLAKIEQQFAQKMQGKNYEMIEAKEYTLEKLHNED